MSNTWAECQSAFVHAAVYKHVYTAKPPVAEAASILLNYNMVWYHKRDYIYIYVCVYKKITLTKYSNT